MNILVVSGAFWPDSTGGVSKAVLAEVEGLVSKGHRLVVLTRRLRKDLPHQEARAGYKVYRYWSPIKGSKFYRLYPVLGWWQAPRLVAQLYRDFRPDVIYVHQNPFAAVGIIHSLKQVAKIPYVYVFHSPIPREIEIDTKAGKYGLVAPLANVVKRWIKTKEREALAQADVIVVRSKFMEEQMRKLHGDVGSRKTICVPLCVDTKRFSFVENPRSVRKKLNLPPNRPILLTVRRLIARVGVEELIIAVKQIKKKIPEILLLIGGRGYLEECLHRMVKNLGLKHNVWFLGFIPESDLPKFYQAADLFVMPTKELEGFGLATIEALSCGTPVVATPIGANQEVLGGLGEEFLCRDVTPESLAERISWWLAYGIGPETRKKCRAFCESNFSIEKVVVIIERILAGKGELKG